MENLHLIDEEGYLIRAVMLVFYEDSEKWVTGSYIKIGYFGDPVGNTGSAYLGLPLADQRKMQELTKRRNTKIILTELLWKGLLHWRNKNTDSG